MIGCETIAAAEVLRALRAATSSAHTALEATLHLAQPDAGKRQYADFVAAFWGWLEPIESRIWIGLQPPQFDAASRGIKAAWLEQDIRAARAEGFLHAALPRRAVAEPFGTMAQCAGWAYVVEGSLLGARVLSRRFGASLAPWPGRWLEGYGAHTANRWAEFVDAMALHVRSPDDIAQCAGSAARAFETLAAWLRERGTA